MAQITGIIPAQAFELIRNKIVEIIGIELDNQFLLSGDYDLDIDVWMERVVPFDQTELHPCAVNVTMLDGDYDNEDQKTADGTYLYSIAVYGKGFSSDSNDGDTMAAVRIQKVLGKIRAILMSTQYKHLGFVHAGGSPNGPFIRNRRISRIELFDPRKNQEQEVNYLSSGHVVFSVKVPENVDVFGFQPARPEQGSDTAIKLYCTNKGYVWSREGFYNAEIPYTDCPS